MSKRAADGGAAAGGDGERVTLCYWAIRGLAAPIRMQLRYLGVAFDDKLERVGPPPEYSKQEWLAKKAQLDLPFPNLPYLIDPQHDARLSQTDAIMRHLARTRDAALLGTTPAQQAAVDVMLGVVGDFRRSITRIAYNADFAALKPNHIATITAAPHGHLVQFNAYLAGHGGPYACGDFLSIADFQLYEMLDQQQIMEPGIYDEKFAAIKAYLATMKALPAIAAYHADPATPTQINNDQATWK